MNHHLSWVLVAGTATVIFWLFWLELPDFPLDDAYIVQHTVDRLLHGGENRFSEASAIHGATSIGHVLLISLFGWLMPIAWAQSVVAGGAFLLFISGVFVLAQREGIKSADSAVLTVLSALAGLTIYHFMNGLETGMAMAAIVWSLIFFYDPIPKKPWYRVLLGLLPFIRPELGALSLMFIIRELWAIRLAGGAHSRLTGIIGWPLLGSLIPSAFLLTYGGSLLPNTMAAKVFFFAEGCQPLAYKLQLSGLAASDFLHGLRLAGVGFFGLAISRYRTLGLAFIIIFFTAYILRFPGALHHNWYRYLYLLTPFMVAGWAAFLSASRKNVLLVARIASIVALISAGINIPDAISKYQNGIATSRLELAGVSQWISKNIEPNAAILIHDAGYISLNGTQPLIDLVGLKTPSSVAIHRDLTWTLCARDPQAIDKIARRNGARYFVVLDDWDRIFKLTTSLRLTGWNVERVDTDRGPTIYKIYRITNPVRK